MDKHAAISESIRREIVRQHDENGWLWVSIGTHAEGNTTVDVTGLLELDQMAEAVCAEMDRLEGKEPS